MAACVRMVLRGTHARVLLASAETTVKLILMSASQLPVGMTLVAFSRPQSVQKTRTILFKLFTALALTTEISAGSVITPHATACVSAAPERFGARHVVSALLAVRRLETCRLYVPTFPRAALLKVRVFLPTCS